MLKNNLALVALLVLATPGFAGCDDAYRSAKATFRKATAQAANSASPARRRDQPEQASQARQQSAPKHDYVLALTWMPEFCSSERPSDPRCQGEPSWALHGLWPKPVDDSIAENCETDAMALDQAAVVGQRVLDSAELARHQWRKHGSCSGLTPAEYFARTRELATTLSIPSELTTALASKAWTLADFEAAWQAANPRLDGARLAVRCRSRSLYELLFCFDDAGQLTRCPSGTRDSCPRDGFLVRGRGS